MLQRILFVFFLLASPLIVLTKITKLKIFKYPYYVLYYLTFVPVLLFIYTIGLAASYKKMKLTELLWALPRLMGYGHYNRDSIELANKKIPGTDHYIGYMPDELPAELVYRWRKEKVFHNYMKTIIKANQDFINVPLATFKAPKPIADEDLKNFISSSQITHYLTKNNGNLVFDMTNFVNETMYSNSSFDVANISISEEFANASMKITMRDGTSFGPGDQHWDLAKIYFMSNTMVYFILGAHLHHHLFFAEMGSALMFNNVPKDSNFYRLMHPHTSYILMLNHQFKSNPLSLRETTGVVDKFLYSCIGYYSGETFYKVGFENGLNMYNKRVTHDDALTKKFDIKFAIPFDKYLNGDYELNKQMKAYYALVHEFISGSYDGLVSDESESYINDWVSGVCRYVNIPIKQNDKSFNIEVIATYIWYVSFVHSLEHYQFHKYEQNYCLLIRKPFAIAKNLPTDQVFTQYDLWKSKHIVNTFGKNHLNAGICEGYFDLDYGFLDKSLTNGQEKFKKNVADLLARHDTPNEAIALSIRY